MKLYTEVEVKFAMDIARCQPNLIFDEVLEELTPIELPSGEEINEQASMYSNVPQEYRSGAKWMKQQILNQKNKHECIWKTSKTSNSNVLICKICGKEKFLINQTK